MKVRWLRSGNMLELPNIAAYQDVHVRSALLTCVQHIALWDNHQLCLNVIPPPSLIVYEMQPADSTWPSNLHTAVFFSLQSLCLVHTGKPAGVAVSHCTTRFQTQLFLTTCQIRYHSHLWDHHHWTALNLDPEGLSRVLRSERATPAHLGLDPPKKSSVGQTSHWTGQSPIAAALSCPHHNDVQHNTSARGLSSAMEGHGQTSRGQTQPFEPVEPLAVQAWSAPSIATAARCEGPRLGTRHSAPGLLLLRKPGHKPRRKHWHKIGHKHGHKHGHNPPSQS